MRTHIALGIGGALYFLPHVNNKSIFFIAVLVATLLPNITNFLNPKKKKAEEDQASRGILHAYTTCIIISVILALYYPAVALPFFIGYSFHLFLDSFTPEGIVPFWPIKKKSSGKIKRGGKIDNAIFYTLILVDIALLLKLFLSAP